MPHKHAKFGKIPLKNLENSCFFLHNETVGLVVVTHPEYVSVKEWLVMRFNSGMYGCVLKIIKKNQFFAVAACLK